MTSIVKTLTICIDNRLPDVPHYWRGTSSTAWENSANWSSSIVPFGSSTGIFDLESTSGNQPIIQDDREIGLIQLKPDFTGIITISSTSQLTVNNTFYLNSGDCTFDIGSGTLISSGINITTGVVVDDGATWYSAGDFVFNPATFTNSVTNSIIFNSNNDGVLNSNKKLGTIRLNKSTENSQITLNSNIGCVSYSGDRGWLSLNGNQILSDTYFYHSGEKLFFGNGELVSTGAVFLVGSGIDFSSGLIHHYDNITWASHIAWTGGGTIIADSVTNTNKLFNNNDINLFNDSIIFNAQTGATQLAKHLSLNDITVSGNLNAAYHRLNIAGNFTIVSGSIVSNLDVVRITGIVNQDININNTLIGRIYFDGSGNKNILSEITTNNFEARNARLNLNSKDIIVNGNMSITDDASFVVTGLAGVNITVTGDCQIVGQSRGNRMQLNPASSWTVGVTGFFSIKNAIIGNLTASQSTCYALDCEEV